MRAFAPAWLKLATLVLAATNIAACRAEDPAEIAEDVAPFALTGRVVDAANIIPANVETELTDRLAALEAQTKVQFVVVSTPSLNGRDIKDYSMQLGDAWGIGDRERNDGLLLVVAPNDRKVRIATGKGMEKKLTDAECAVVIERMMVNFKANDLTGGIVLGTELLDRAVRDEFGQTA